LIASVFVNIPVKSIAKAFSYHVPEELARRGVGPGWRVFVPFGGRKVEGFVVALTEQAPEGVTLKDIIAAVDDEAWFSPRMLEAARWLAEFYLCSLAEMMRLFMPGKSGLKITVRYVAEYGLSEQGQLLLAMPQYKSLYDLLAAEGPLSRLELKHRCCESSAAGDEADGESVFPDEHALDTALERMLQYHVLSRDYAAKKRDAARYEKVLVLSQPVTPGLLAGLGRKKAQQKLLQLLADSSEGRMTQAAAKEQGVSLATMKNLAAGGLIEIQSRRVLRDSYAAEPGRLPAGISREDFTLSADQQRVVAAVEPVLSEHSYHGFLLQGVTGSGKTQVYIELARRTRELGRQVVVLVPEIALTGQVVTAFKAYFPRDIIVVHSRLSLAERNDAMIRARRHEAGIVIGARSALFTPLDDIGLIVIDEEQDSSYKQDESPRYHARVVAGELARIHGSALLLGSATPSLESFYRARAGSLTLLSMPHRIGDLPLPRVRCVDMRRELAMGNRHIISRELEQLIRDTLARREQVIIMLNRRGFSTFVMCRSCGAVMKCRECGLPLVYHRNGSLVCHHCDIREPVPDICPQCGSRYIKYFGSGTEKLEQELRELVPQARVIRMDRDTTGRKFAHRDILTAFRRHEYDILLGTQMVAKGHDIPSVTAVGIISADSALNMPDFRAAERCFMLITQTAGRAGRHTGEGHVVIQTYNPEHYAVRCGMAQDYAGFYERELQQRWQLFYPPFSRLIKLLFQADDEQKARQAAEDFASRFEQQFHDNMVPLGQPGDQEKKLTMQLAGPAPAVIACFRGTYRFVVLIKTADMRAVHAFLKAEQLHLRTDVAIDIDPLNTL